MRILKLTVINSFLVIFLLSSCYEKQEGCLDIIATNFDYGADLDCDNCCEYPELRFLINHAIDTFAFKTGIPFEIGDGQVVRFEEIIYLFSNVFLKNVDGELLTVEDAVTIIDHDQADAEKVIPDYFAKIAYPKFNYSIGTFRNLGQFDSLQFSLGVEGLIELDNPDNDHALAADEDSLFISKDEGFINTRIIMQTDTAIEKLDTFLLSGPELAQSFLLPVIIDFQGSEDLIIELKADYLKWFEGVNFTDQSHEEVMNKIKLNSKNVFSAF